jgi:EAL domain-containing protein (putative c-di-GMP-specific phosphodiesterase class I)
LAKLQPDIVKIDMELVRGIDVDRIKRTIVRHTLAMLDDLGITPLCEGIETDGEAETLIELGVDLLQGYFYAKPGFEKFPVPVGFNTR